MKKGSAVDQRMPLRRGLNRVLGALLVVLSLGMLAGCGGSEGGGEEKAIPASPEEAGSVLVRVSGAEGVAYSGDYSSFGAESPEIVDGVLDGEPVEYEVEIQSGGDDPVGLPGGVLAFIRKTEPGTGGLTVEIVADDETVVESTTYADMGVVSAEWAPQPDLPEGGIPPDEGIPGEGIPEEDISGEEPPPPEQDNP